MQTSMSESTIHAQLSNLTIAIPILIEDANVITFENDTR
jgi:hypothetical protein